MSKTPITLESLTARIKKEVAAKAQQSERRKLEAREERKRREAAPSIYEREDLWFPVAIHREYEVQLCDCCKQEQTVFNRDKVELHHRHDRSARRWLHERGETMSALPIRIEILERVIPECFTCLTLGKILNHLWKGSPNAQTNSQVEVGVPQGGSVAP